MRTRGPLQGHMLLENKILLLCGLWLGWWVWALYQVVELAVSEQYGH